MDTNKPKLAVLFWFYKEVDVCLNRLEIIRKYNPNVEIYGLYGGDSADSDIFETKLSKYLKSFYTSPFSDPDWKWIHGDLVILDWYEKNGQKLDFDSIVIVQWDMLFFDSVEKQFNILNKNEIYLSGYRDLDEYTEKNWEWTDPKKQYRQNYLDFIKYVKDNYSYNSEQIHCCLFVLEVIPKIFFDKYLGVRDKEIGMLEYKIPIYSEIFDIKVVSRPNEAHWWDEVEKYPLNAEPIEIKEEYIKKELKKENGWRIFHPYFRKWQDHI